MKTDNILVQKRSCNPIARGRISVADGSSIPSHDYLVWGVRSVGIVLTAVAAEASDEDGLTQTSQLGISLAIEGFTLEMISLLLSGRDEIRLSLVAKRVMALFVDMSTDGKCTYAVESADVTLRLNGDGLVLAAAGVLGRLEAGQSFFDANAHFTVETNLPWAMLALLGASLAVRSSEFTGRKAWPLSTNLSIPTQEKLGTLLAYARPRRSGRFMRPAPVDLVALTNPEISFDTLNEDLEDWSCFEGCYRVNSSDWKVFYFLRTEHHPSEVITDATFSSGIKGIHVYFPPYRTLNKRVVKKIMADILDVPEWIEVIGPDSLVLK